jgi:hypothetical protein
MHFLEAIGKNGWQWQATLGEINLKASRAKAFLDRAVGSGYTIEAFGYRGCRGEEDISTESAAPS